MYAVDDPAGTPASKKITFDNVQLSLTKVGKVSVTQPATGSTLVIPDGVTLTGPSVSGTTATLAGTETLSGKTLTAPKLADGGFIADANGNEVLVATTTASAVTYVQAVPGATTVAPKIIGAGETNTGLLLAGSGTGKVRIGDGADNTKLLTVELVGATTAKTMTVTSSHTDNRTLTLPDATDTLVGKATTDTLTNKTIGAGTLVLAENASIALDPALSADGKYSGTTIAGTAGATLAFGQLIYLAVADSRWELTDADAVATAGAVLTGMCVLAAAADGDPTVVLLDGNIRADAQFPALTVGAPVYAGVTPGEIVVAKPSGTDDVIHVVGFALTADSILFRPSFNHATAV